MDDERTPVKTKQFVVDGSKSKTDLRKARAAYRFEKSGCKRPHFTEAWLQNRFTLARRKNKPGFRRMKIFINTQTKWVMMMYSHGAVYAVHSALLVQFCYCCISLLFQRYKTIGTVLRAARNIVRMKKMTQRKYQTARHGLSNDCEKRFDEDRETLFVLLKKLLSK